MSTDEIRNASAVTSATMGQIRAAMQKHDRSPIWCGFYVVAGFLTRNPRLSEKEKIAYADSRERDVSMTTHIHPKCPHCKSEDIDGKSVEIERASAIQEVGCNDCGATWVDTYTHTNSQMTYEPEA